MLAPLGADLTLTTNGSPLVKHARALKDAGLDRITVSLDSLDDATFRAMNDVDFPVEKVLDGIDAAADAGLAPIKINMVVKRGVNDDQIVDAARHWRGSGPHPALHRVHGRRQHQRLAHGRRGALGRGRAAHRRGVPARAGRRELRRRSRRALALQGRRGRDRRHLLGDAGLLRATATACASRPRARSTPACSRSRATTCKSLLRGGADDDAIRDAIAAVWRVRDDRYSEIRTAETAKQRKVEMSYIGG